MSILQSKPLLILSPHPDDAVLSCGGLLAAHSDALVITVFAADPPQARPEPLATLFADQETRRAEDERAMRLLRCNHAFLNHNDAIDRLHEGQRVYTRVEDVFGALAPADVALVKELEAEIASLLDGRILVSPLAVGAHVDHQICAHVGRRLARAGHVVFFYQDAPYVFPNPGPTLAGDTVLRAAARMRGRIRGIEDVEIDIDAKEAALACYESQVRMLFGDMLSYRRLANAHYENLGGDIERFHAIDW